VQYRKVGSSDLQASVIGLGANNFGNPQRIADPAQSARVLHACLDAGVNFIDTAAAYGGGQSEVHIGEALQGGRRQKMLIATKFDFGKREGTVAEQIARSAETSLKKLRTDYIDLYQVHALPPDLTYEQVLEPLAALVKQGKVRHIGECNYAGWRHAQSDAVSERRGWPKLVSSQNYYNVLRRQVELELLPYCTASNVGFLPYFPLAGGWLSGKYAPGAAPKAGARSMIGPLQKDERARAILERLTAFARERGRSVLELAFAWLLAHPAVSSVIAGATTPEQVKANAAAAGWQMSAEERAAIDAIAAWDGTNEEIEGSGPGGAKPRF
jgi:aryl-alcohol dehydrogenase-like predicted oxidoreductase